MKLNRPLKTILAAAFAASMASTAYAGGTLRYATVGEPPSLD